MERSILPKAWEGVINSKGYMPVIVKSIEMFHDKTWSMEPSSHDHYETLYVKKGEAVFEIAGKPVPIGPNDLVIIKPNQSHKLIVESPSGCEYIVLSFKFENAGTGEFSKISLDDFLNFVSGKDSGAYIALKVSQKNEIIVLLNKILNEQEEDLGSGFLTYLLVLELFVHISRALKNEWENTIKNKSPKLKELISASQAYIHNNFERDISIGDIAKYIFLSKSYFAKAFKDEIGTSPMNYLLRVRIQRAKEMLAETDLKICDIALNVGFSNQQRFNEIFKKYTDLTPLKYRKQEKTAE